MSVVRELIAELGTVCAGLPDRRKGPRGSDDYSMADIGLSAFSLFFLMSSVGTPVGLLPAAASIATFVCLLRPEVRAWLVRR